MIYHVPDDPELGYFGDDEVATIRGRSFIVTHLGMIVGVEPADCSICGAAIPDDATVPLCRTCEATAKAHARLEVEAKRYPDPEHG